MAHNAAGFSLTKYETGQLGKTSGGFETRYARMLDRSQAFFGPEQAATTVPPTPRLRWQGGQHFSICFTVSLLTQDPEGMCY